MTTKKEYNHVNIESDGDAIKPKHKTGYISVKLVHLILIALIGGIILFGFGIITGISIDKCLNSYNNTSNNSNDDVITNENNDKAYTPTPEVVSAPPSDYRLKYDIKLLNDDINPYKNIGLNYYTWKWKNILSNNVYIDNEYIDDNAFGVIAQEVLLLYPDAVTQLDDGYFAVYYSLLNEYTKNIHNYK
mmetsp:Transcript_102054/g.124862  ORF Transcript_102054/g.124862 Transcript_102054/m.124862 type:complete len:189 (-) Transcript_102054:125-691(-)